MHFLLSGISRLLRNLLSAVNAHPQPPSPADLDSLVDHIAYEFAALEKSAELYQVQPVWVFLETFLLHARQLREFFWGKADKRDRHAGSSVFAEHYCKVWRGARGGYPRAVKETKKAIDTQLAHITRDRIHPHKSQDLGAKVLPLRDELRTVWKNFIMKLGSDPRATLFAQALVKRCTELGVQPPP